MYDQVTANKRRSWLLVAGFVIFVALVCAAFAYFSATTRISDLVLAAKQYSQMDRAPYRWIDLHEDDLRVVEVGLDPVGVDQDSHMLWGKDDSALLETYRSVDEAVGRQAH